MKCLTSGIRCDSVVPMKDDTTYAKELQATCLSSVVRFFELDQVNKAPGQGSRW